jgi:hypothetical protein
MLCDGWIFDAYPVFEGMRVWAILVDGRRVILLIRGGRLLLWRALPGIGRDPFWLEFGRHLSIVPLGGR